MSYDFTLILSGFSELTDDVEDRIFEAGCDDATLGVLDGTPFLDFSREAPSLQEAVLSAISDVQRAGFQVVRIEPNNLVSAAEIARRTGRTRENIRQLRTSARGPGHFPTPVAVKGSTQLWQWSEVAEWFSKYQETNVTPQVVSDARTIATVNALIDLKRNAESSEAVETLWRRINPPEQRKKEPA